MISPFGVDHGDEVSKGLPRAVKAGGGGYHGNLLRLKNETGKLGAKHEFLRNSGKQRGKQIKDAVHADRLGLEVKQNRSLSDGTNPAARRIRAGLLNGDSEARRAGYKTGKSSALDRHYQGRISSRMKALP